VPGLDDGQTVECQRFGHCGSTDQERVSSTSFCFVRSHDQLLLSDRSFELLDFGLGFWKDFATLG
jgi:hypothetical protein